MRSLINQHPTLPMNRPRLTISRRLAWSTMGPPEAVIRAGSGSDLTSPTCKNCRKRGDDCSGPRIGWNEPDFRPLKLPTKEWIDYDYPPVRTAKRLQTIQASRQVSPVSDTSESHEETFFRNTVLVPGMSSGGLYGNATVGLYQANSTLFELIHLWQAKFLGQPSSGTAATLSRRAQALSSLALFDDCKGYCWMSYMASYHNMLTESNAMRQVQVESHAQAIVKLREKFVKYDLAMPLLATLNTLINAEFAAGDYSTAEHHTKFLAEELDPASCRSPGFTRLRHTVIIMELERSCATFTRPVFDINAWVAHDQAQEILESRSQTLAFRFPSTVPTCLDTEALSDPRLVDVFTRIHHFDQIFKAVELTDTVTRGFAYQLSWAALQLEHDLLHHCLDLFDIATTPRSPLNDIGLHKALEYLDRCQHAAAALAALVYFRIRLRCEQSGSGGSSDSALMERFWSIGPMLAKRMAALLEKSEVFARQLCERHKQNAGNIKAADSSANCRSRSIPPSIRLRLWVLYVGTWIEATSWYRNAKRSSYFSETLGKLCDSLFGDESSASRESAIEDILKGFIVLEHQKEVKAPHAVTLKQGPEWLSPALRTWGFANWDGDLA